jgi:hypothetical protein
VSAYGSPWRTGVGRMGAGKYLRASCQVWRQDETGVFEQVGGTFRCAITDVTDSALAADPTNASLREQSVWRVDFARGVEVFGRDQLRNATLPDGRVLPTLTVSRAERGQGHSTYGVIATAEEQSTAKEMVTFYREVGGVLTPFGPYPVSLEWANREPQQGGSYAANTRLASGALVGADAMSVRVGDLMGPIEGKKGGKVTEVRKPVAGQMEVRFVVDLGVG